MTEYTSVKVPKELAVSIEKCKLFKLLGCTSVSNFVLYMTREGVSRT